MEIEKMAEHYGIGTKSDWQLYSDLNLIIKDLEKMGKFILAGSGMGGEDFSIDFSIAVPNFGDLPKSLSDLFFDKLNMNYSVKIQKTDLYKHNNENHFQIEIKK